VSNSKETATTAGIRRRDFLKGGAAAAAATVLVAQGSVAQSPAPKRSRAGENSWAGKLTAPGEPKPWNVPQRPTPPISIDVHTHWAPEAYMKAKAEYGQPDLSSPNNADLEQRAKLMDAQGVQMQVLTLGGFMPWQWVNAEQGAHIAQIANDAAIQAHTAFPDRFIAGIELPVGDPVGSLKELNRVAGKPGLVAVHLPNSLAGREYLFEPGFAPVLARCEELNLPLLIHPLDGEPNWYAGHRLADAYSGEMTPGANRFPGLTNTVGEMYEQGTTVSKLIVSGTLDKYPKLQMVIAHAGGAFPYVVGRLDFRAPSLPKLQYPMKDYIRRFYFDSLAFYPPTLDYLITMVGSDRVVVGTDSMGPPAPQPQNANAPAGPRPQGGGQGAFLPHSVIDQVEMSAEDRDLILRGNLKRLFKLT
jgi:aminocarboxymuconate-semialdehyde decarboxylase